MRTGWVRSRGSKARMAGASAAALLFGLAGPAAAQSMAETDSYFLGGQADLEARATLKLNRRRAKNVILFVADGLDVTTITAARIYDGQRRGEEGEENALSFEGFPHVGLVKTYNTDRQTPDSAGTMTAMVTGVKTKAGVVSLTDKAKRGDCASARGARTATLVELAETAGLATGVVSTARLTHATPAAAYAHSPDRNWESDLNLPDSAVEAGCVDIARQLIEFPYGDGLEVAMGGGRSSFLPKDAPDHEDEDARGNRSDGRDLVREWTAKSDAHVYVWDRTGFDGLDASADQKVLGLFERSHMKYELDRPGDGAGEPSLEEMTRWAVERLARNRRGFILIVEAGRVDHAHHAGNAKRALSDAQEFAEAVAAADALTRDADTLIIVTADHGHTMSLGGYGRKGGDILGLAEIIGEDGAPKLLLASDRKPYTTLLYANGPGAVFYGAPVSVGRPALASEAVASPAYLQQAVVPLAAETHGGQDVSIYAKGPRAYLFGGVMEQSYIFHAIDRALNLRRSALKAAAR